MTASSLPGFRDFYPETLAQRRHLFEGWREVARRYGFSEYDGPPLEPLELYTRKSGDEIVEQLYAFTDKGDREVALRPEMTPTLARMVGARAGALPKPIKWFAIPQLFRYEKPQRGRLREHFQLNMDIVGEAGVAADAEIVAAAIDAVRVLGLGPTEFEARISDRRLVGLLLAECGVPEERLVDAFGALDRSERRGEDWLREKLDELGPTDEQIERILKFRETDLAGIIETFADRPSIVERGDELQEFFGLLSSYGFGEFVRFDPHLARGLAYYTGIVFELWEREGRLRAICGGGRYDDLLASLGGPDLPATGFGMGDVVLGELLAERGLTPETGSRLDDFVVYVTAAERPLALKVVRGLRELGRSAALDYRGRAVGKQFRLADQAGAARTVVIGPDEAKADAVSVRDMETGAERVVPIDTLLRGGAGG